MIYIVFSEGREDFFNVAFAGGDKGKAVKSFTETAGNACVVYSNITKVHLVGFDIESAPGNEFRTKSAKKYVKEDIIKILQNLDKAVCSYTLFAAERKTSSLYSCNKCSTTTTVLNKNVFGEYLCDACWNSYLTSEQGLLEYYIGLADGAYKVSAFSTDEKKAIKEAWTKYKDLVERTEDEKSLIEQTVENLIA